MFPRFFIVLCLFAISCKGRGPSNPVNSLVHKKTVVANKKVDTIPPEPNADTLQAQLYDFFARHKLQDTFDTTEIAYAEYWGWTGYSPDFIRAGHLFNRRQVHALLFYVRQDVATMAVFLKKAGRWQKIFENDSMSTRVNIQLKDWNMDGTNDISDRYTNAWSYNWSLWLVDRSGEKVHPIPDFEYINNPVVDPITGDIEFDFLHAGGQSFGTYRFIGYDLREIDDWSIWADRDNEKECTISHEHLGREVKHIKVSATKVEKYVPARWKKVAADFNKY